MSCYIMHALISSGLDAISKDYSNVTSPLLGWSLTKQNHLHTRFIAKSQIFLRILKNLRFIGEKP